MDSGDSKEDGTTTRRRSTRHASKPALYSDALTPRPPLKRTRKMREDDGSSRAVNGSKESKSPEEGVADEPSVKTRKIKETEKASHTKESGDEFKPIDEADVEMGEDGDQDQDMNSVEEGEQDHTLSLKVDSSALSGTEEKHPFRAHRENLINEGILDSPIPIPQNKVDVKIPRLQIPTKTYRLITTSGEPSSLGGIPTENQHKAFTKRNKNSLNSQNLKMEMAKNDPCPGNWKIYSPTPQQSNIYSTIKHPIINQASHHKSTVLKNSQKPVTSKASPVSSSGGWLWDMYKLLQCSLILIGLLALGFLTYNMFPWLHLPQTHMSHSETTDKFDVKLSALKELFPSQRPVFWTRSGKHLKRHLEMVSPTEPVSVILTAGLQAERTLGCLARSLATVYSSFHSASILEINGTIKSAKNSDQVKLEIDEALQEAFEGDKPAAVVHRFEELPPGSTLIFYRYCDHENAAYKNVFLVFTVMLSVNEISPKDSLSTVEEMVQNHVKRKFVSSDKSAEFNQMDVDKLSGLWSRISHVILPVASEEEIERQGCTD